jgi:hypothetical protein
MALLDIDESTRVDTDTVATIEFRHDPSSPLFERADLFLVRGSELALAVPNTINSIPVLQKLREVVGDGTGRTGWVRIRKEGTTGDRADSYANLNNICRAKFGRASDGEIARLEASAGIPVGEVHLPGALEAVRLRNLAINQRRE